jgi:hypothetical protein
MTKGIFLFLAFTAIFVFMTGFALAATPSGANYTGEVTTTAAADDPQSHSAIAGNVTYLSVTGYSTTQSWQGYYGNVSGTIQLANSGDKVLYNWSLASPSGEIYASENGTGAIIWANITCYNYTGNYSAGGPRLAKLETRFNLSSNDADGVNETFSDENTHTTFFAAGNSFTAGACPATYMYDDTGKGTAGTYEEVLLTDASADEQVVFAALLEKDETGFDGLSYDFEMIVLEKGKNGDTNPRNYYFYVELE